MTRSKREQWLKENERYPLRSLTSEERQRFAHEEELAERRKKDHQRKKDEDDE